MESFLAKALVLAFLKTIGTVYGFSPKWLRRGVEKCLAILFRATSFKQKVIIENLKICFPEKEAEFGRNLLEFYEAFARLVFEVTMLFGVGNPMARYLKNEVKVTGTEHWQKAHDLGRGVIFVSSHVGNWEIMVGSAGRLNMNLLMVTKRLKPRWLHSVIENARLKLAVRGAYEPRTLSAVNEHLRQGGTVGFVIDQYTGPPVGIRVPFFGKYVGTHSAVALTAKRSGAPILPVVCYVNKTGSHQIDILPAVDWVTDDNAHREIALNTATLGRFSEQCVRDHLHQWLWIHRRFKGNLGPLEPGEWENPRIRRGR